KTTRKDEWTGELARFDEANGPVFRNSFHYEHEKTARQRVYNWDADAVNNEASHIPRPSYNEQGAQAETARRTRCRLHLLGA
ncbi:hypothetical protein ALC62_08235, partial [Cyphomyrmex costatus]